MHLTRAFGISLLTLLVAVRLPAQRSKPTLTWQDATAAIDYGVVPLGKHGLSELKIGDQWRLGQGDATRLSLQMPVLVGETVVPPGEYRLRLNRVADSKCSVSLQGTQFVLGQEVQVDGELGKVPKPAKKLAIDWLKGQSKDKYTLPVQLLVQFGDSDWKGAIDVYGSKRGKVGAYELVTFALPADALKRRAKQPIAVATMHKKSGPDAAQFYTVLLGADEVKVVPWTAVPADNFAELAGPSEFNIVKGKVESSPVAGDAVVPFLELRGAQLQKGTLSLQFAVDKEVLTLTVGEPKDPSVKGQ